MKITLLETNFKIKGKLVEGRLSMDPTRDMHYIEEMELHYDSIKMPYALVECRSKSSFLGWALITKDSYGQ